MVKIPQGSSGHVQNVTHSASTKKPSPGSKKTSNIAMKILLNIAWALTNPLTAFRTVKSNIASSLSGRASQANKGGVTTKDENRLLALKAAQSRTDVVAMNCFIAALPPHQSKPVESATEARAKYDVTSTPTETSMHTHMKIPGAKISFTKSGKLQVKYKAGEKEITETSDKPMGTLIFKKILNDPDMESSIKSFLEAHFQQKQTLAGTSEATFTKDEKTAALLYGEIKIGGVEINKIVITMTQDEAIEAPVENGLKAKYLDTQFAKRKLSAQEFQTALKCGKPLFDTENGKVTNFRVHLGENVYSTNKIQTKIHIKVAILNRYDNNQKSGLTIEEALGDMGLDPPKFKTLTGKDFDDSALKYVAR